MLSAIMAQSLLHLCRQCGLREGRDYTLAPPGLWGGALVTDKGRRKLLRMAAADPALLAELDAVTRLLAHAVATTMPLPGYHRERLLESVQPRQDRRQPSRRPN